MTMRSRTISIDAPSAPKRRTAAGQEGFTLVEVLVAFTILALLTITIQRGVGVALHGTARAQERIEAENIARTLLTGPMTTGAGALAPRSGRMNGHSWTLRFKPTGVSFPTATAAEGKPPLWSPLRMIVSVGNERGSGPAVVVETIRLVKVVAQ